MLSEAVRPKSSVTLAVIECAPGARSVNVNAGPPAPTSVAPSTYHTNLLLISPSVGILADPRKEILFPSINVAPLVGEIIFTVGGSELANGVVCEPAAAADMVL